MQYRRDHWTERSRASQNRCVMSLLMHREPEKGGPDLPPPHQHIPDHDWRLADEPSQGSATAITDAHRPRHPSLHRDHHPDGDTHPAGTHQRTTPALWHCALSDRSVSHCEWPGTMKQVSAPSPKHQQPTGHCLTPAQTFAPTTNGWSPRPVTCNHLHPAPTVLAWSVESVTDIMPLLFLLSQALEPVPESSNGHRMGFAPSPGPDRSSHRDEGEILPRISVRSESLTAGSPHQQDLPLRGIRRRSHRSGTTPPGTTYDKPSVASREASHPGQSLSQGKSTWEWIQRTRVARSGIVFHVKPMATSVMP